MISLSYFFYNVFSILLSVFAIPVFLPKVLLSKGSFHRERWGFYAPGVFQKLGKRPLVWFHAASVGEVSVALSLLVEMRKAYSHYGFVVSTSTTQGREIASQAHGVDVALLAPLDLRWVVRRAVKLIKPRLLLVTETELWPNLLREVIGRGYPLCSLMGGSPVDPTVFIVPCGSFSGVSLSILTPCVSSPAQTENG